MEYWLNIDKNTATGTGHGPNSARADARSRGSRAATTVQTDTTGHETASRLLGGPSSISLAEMTVMDALNLEDAPTLPAPGFGYSAAVAHRAIDNGATPSDKSFAFPDGSAIFVEQPIGRCTMWIRLPG